MKKISCGFILLPILLWVAGCAETDPPVKIINNSSYEVSFVFANLPGTQTIASLSTKTYEVANGALLSYTASPEPWISYTLNGHFEGVFDNAAAINCKILNTLDIDVEIVTGGYLDPEPLTILSGQTKSALIYTKKPKIELSSGAFDLKPTIVYDAHDTIGDPNPPTLYITIR